VLYQQSVEANNILRAGLADAADTSSPNPVLRFRVYRSGEVGYFEMRMVSTYSRGSVARPWARSWPAAPQLIHVSATSSNLDIEDMLGVASGRLS
jgi:hypothetical protein